MALLQKIKQTVNAAAKSVNKAAGKVTSGVSKKGNSGVSNSISNSAFDTGSIYGETSKPEETEEQKLKSYEEWRAIMKSRGFEKLSREDFTLYANGLDKDFQDWILKKDEGGYTEADKELQAKIASVFASNGKRNVDNDALVKTLNSIGLEATKEWHDETGHVKDLDSKTGHAGQHVNSGVYVVTVKDPETGAEIRIADSNGNGIIEIEEVFLNEILEGVANNIDMMNINVSIASGLGASGSGGGGSGIDGDSEQDTARTAEGKMIVTQKDFDAIKERVREAYSKKYSAELLNSKLAQFMETFTISSEAKAVDVSEIAKAA